jgi:hypothetical protein
MTRPWVLIGAASAALFSIALLTRSFPGGAPPGVQHGSQRTGRSGPDAADEQGNSSVGWTAKSAPGFASSSGSGGAGLSGDSKARQSTSADAGAGGSLAGADGPTVVSGGRRSGTTIGTGRAAVGEGGNALSVPGSISAAPLIDKRGPLAGANRLPASQQPQVTHEVTVQPQGQDPAKSDTTDDQGPVVSIPFDQSTAPEKGDAPVLEHDIAFDGQGATFSTDSQFAIPDAANLTGEAGTISFCLRPQWGGEETNTDASLVNVHTPNLFDNRLQITKNGTYLRFLMADNTGHEAGAGTNISTWQAGQSHLVTAVWGQALSSLYVDGQLAGSQTYEGQVQFAPGTPMYVGSDYTGGIPGARSSLSNFEVYNRPLTQDEISGLAAGCQ